MSQITSDIFSIIENYSSQIILGLGFGVLLLLILNIILMVKASKSKKNYDALVNGVSGVNIEELLTKTGEDLRLVESDIERLTSSIKELDLRLTFAVQKVGFIRYNAFDGMGSKMSFSIALMDDFKNGFVITGIYGRESTTCYAKEIKQAEGLHQLSEEEKEAVKRALIGNEER